MSSTEALLADDGDGRAVRGVLALHDTTPLLAFHDALQTCVSEGAKSECLLHDNWRKVSPQAPRLSPGWIFPESSASKYSTPPPLGVSQIR